MVAFQYLRKAGNGILKAFQILRAVHLNNNKGQQIIPQCIGIGADSIFFDDAGQLQLTDAFRNSGNGKIYLLADFGGACPGCSPLIWKV